MTYPLSLAQIIPHSSPYRPYNQTLSDSALFTVYFSYMWLFSHRWHRREIEALWPGPSQCIVGLHELLFG